MWFQCLSAQEETFLKTSTEKMLIVWAYSYANEDKKKICLSEMKWAHM